MKKALCAHTALCLLIAVPALGAEERAGRPIAEGVVAAVNEQNITAPMTGTRDAVEMEAGDAVTAGQTLMGLSLIHILEPLWELSTTRLWAPRRTGGSCTNSAAFCSPTARAVCFPSR